MVLYGYDMIDRHIKSFVRKNIDSVAMLQNRFTPKWPIAIV
jgi:hypothetical protein